MNAKEARRYVDIVIESLLNAGKISEDTYGKLTEEFQNEIAESVVIASEE